MWRLRAVTPFLTLGNFLPLSFDLQWWDRYFPLTEGSKRRTRFLSEALIVSIEARKRRLTRLAFLRRRWLLPPLVYSIFPDLVIFNLLAVPLCVFSLGTSFLSRNALFGQASFTLYGGEDHQHASALHTWLPFGGGHVRQVVSYPF